MALFYLIFAVVLIPLIIIGIIGLVIGIILLIVGLSSRKSVKHQGKLFPKVFIVLGTILVCIPVLTVGTAVTVGVVSNINGGGSLPERWRNTWIISENTASDDAIKALLKAGGEGDREALEKCFAEETRNSPDFSKELDSFLEAFPSELSECELDGSSTGSSTSYNYGHNVRTAGARYECELNGEKYYISLEFCFENTDEPDKVGVTNYSVRNFEAQALYLEAVNSDPDSKRPAIVCDIRSSEEVNARLIDKTPYIWHPTSGKKLSEDEMRKLLSGTDSMNELKSAIGEPNVFFKMYNSTGYDFYYELSSNDSEPKYAYIVAGSPNGEIYYAYLCTAENIYFDNPLKEREES